MADHGKAIIFGDLSSDSIAGLSSILGYKENTFLLSFFERVAFALRTEIGLLPLSERQNFIQFTDFAELVTRAQKTANLHPALVKALACTYQFACFIGQYTQPGQQYPSSTTRLVGLCTGLLTAAAVSCCQTITELIPLATHTVVIAFRIGKLVAEVRDRIEAPEGASETWSIVAPGLRGADAIILLHKFNKEKGFPATSVAYISNYSINGVTLSGPPSTLNELIASNYLPRNSPLKIAIHAPYHAGHLFEWIDLDKIMQYTMSTKFADQERKLLVASSISTWAHATAFGSLLKQALEEILIEPLRLDRIASALAQDAKINARKSYTLLPVATMASQTFVVALKKGAEVEVDVDACMNSAISVRSDDGVPTGQLSHSKLAIIGYSGRYPDAANNEEFWKLLHEGRDVVSHTPIKRWDIKTHVDPTLKKKNTSGTPWGCWINEPGLFDAKFFNLSPREAPQVDPAQRLALMTAYEAMENAGVVPDATPSTQCDRVGVFYGTTSNDWGETNSPQNLDTYYIPGTCRAFIPGRQNFFFKFSGPSFSVDTACSSGLAALNLACNSLWRGDIDMAIAGGTNVMTNPDITGGLDRGHFLSRTGNCKTFDNEADGYCRGEGVCSVVVKRLEDAKADNDPIVAVILGAYTNHSAEAESITRPHVGAQKAIFEKLLTSTSTDPYSIGYIEMHGTGTQAGDAREMESVLSVFASSTMRPRKDAEKLYLGSAKANVGHGESASGIIALIKSLMMMERNEIPPHVGIKKEINKKFPTDLVQRNIHIAREPTVWKRPEGGERRVFINNFSAAGGNTSLLIEDAPIINKPEAKDPRSCHVVALSAKSDTALIANMKSLLQYIKEDAPALPSLSYTTTARRQHHSYRVLMSGSSLADIDSQLTSKLASSEGPARARALQRVAFAFTGQGSQYLGMGRELLNFATFRGDIERFNAIAQKQGFPSILPLMHQKDGDISDLPPLVVQLATTCIQMAMAKLWKSLGVEPSAVVGHSLGEYAALNIAGVLSEADTIYLTGTRALLLQQKIPQNTHAMLAVSTAPENISKLCHGLEYEIACQNAATETVLSGTNEQIDKVLEILSSTKLKKTKLRVPFAFHSSQMQPVLGDFIQAARAVKFNTPKIPVISPLLGQVLTTKDAFGPEYLANHCRKTVDFAAAIGSAQSSGLLTSVMWVEIGAHPVVSGLLKANLGGATKCLPTLQRNKDAWKSVTTTLVGLYEAGVNIKWHEYHRDFASSLSVLRLPNYNWDLKEYWMQYVNDWSLYKGDARFLQNGEGFNTTCVHKIVEEKKDGDKVLVVGECDVLREDVDPFVRGHRVNNVPLVTPSVYAEMGLVLGEYLRKSRPELADTMVDLQHMDVQRPFATKAKGKGPQLLRCRVDLDMKSQKASVEFWSVTPEGKKLVKHAEASITFPIAKAVRDEAQKKATSILAQIADLEKRLSTDDRVQKMTGNTGYQLVSSLAGYDDDYKGVSAVILDSANLEATTIVRFNNPKMGGTYHVHPYLIDNFGQPALFTMNANDKADLSKEVFVNHGWKSLHFYKPVSIDKVYRSYVKMSGPHEDGMYSGDMFVFEGKEVVALYKGIKAQSVPRRLMDYIVHMRDDTKAGAPVGGTMAANRPQDGNAANVNGTGLPEADTSGDTWQAALKIISEESGIPVEEFKPESAFDDMGVDSLLSLLCASRFREELGLHHESTIFLDHPTLKELEAFWKGGASTSGPVSGNDAVLTSMFAENADADDDTNSNEEASSSDFSLIDSAANSSDTSLSLSPTPKISATSLLLQGNPKLSTTTKTLFLLPDGSGSCSSYGAIPKIHPSVAVVGVNCPFMKTPEHYNCGIEKVAEMYIAEIRRRQPQGPYALGGWSVGGIFAYNVAQQLTAAGEEVTELVFIDCPVPKGLDHLPTRYYEYLASVGLVGEVNGIKKEPPKWLVQHFEKCVDSLHPYHATPFAPESKAPKVQIIWACDAIDKYIEPKFDRRKDDPEGLKFLTEMRSDFGPCGWETLLPEENMKFARINGANHFSMMKGEFGKVLSEVIENFLTAEG